MTNQEALWLDQFLSKKRCSKQSFEASTVFGIFWWFLVVPAFKAKGSQCKWQRIQGVPAHLFSN